MTKKKNTFEVSEFIFEFLNRPHISQHLEEEALSQKKANKVEQLRKDYRDLSKIHEDLEYDYFILLCDNQHSHRKIMKLEREIEKYRESSDALAAIEDHLYDSAWTHDEVSHVSQLIDNLKEII